MRDMDRKQHNIFTENISTPTIFRVTDSNSKQNHISPPVAPMLLLQKAVQQIDDKDYAIPYTAKGKK
jgi:hypothetical protein